MQFRKLFASILIVALMLSILPAQFSASAATSELFFSEYIEGGNLKGLIDSRKLYEGGKDKTLKRMLDILIQLLVSTKGKS